MSSDLAPKPNKSLRIVFIALAFVSVAFAVGLGVLIFYMVRPRGEKVGETSLTDPRATLLVTGQRGDSLVFRVDASIGMPRLALLSDDELERRASAQLSRSMLTVRAAAPSGSQRNATCPLYKGRALSTSSTSGAFVRSGMLNDCVITLDEPGPWQVSGSVAWAADLTLNSASLETRLEAAPR